MRMIPVVAFALLAGCGMQTAPGAVAQAPPASAASAASALSAASVASAASAANAARLADALEAALSARAFRGARLSALVVERRSGRVLFARAPDRTLTPASTQKLLTAVAALDAFGAAHRFETLLAAPAAPDAEGAISELYVRGGGDPSLTSEQYWRLAADLRAAGVSRISGALILDDSLFDAQRLHPGWGRASSRAYYGPVGALSANYSAFSLRVLPGAARGAPALLRIDPPIAYLRPSGRVRTGAPGSQAELRVERRAAGDALDVKVSGSVPLGSSARDVWRSVADPRGYAGAVLGMQLAANGIEVGGPARPGPVPAGARELLRFRGYPLRRVVTLMLKYSNNMMAESLVKSLAVAEGETGAWPAGIAALRRRLARLGVPLGGLAIVDGSGLSGKNRLSARSLVSALRVADARFAMGPELLSALPRAAEDGTLEERAAAARLRLRAKTGRLSGVSTLAGFAEHRDGRRLVFALLVNGAGGDDAGLSAAVDAFAEALVGAGGR